MGVVVVCLFLVAAKLFIKKISGWQKNIAYLITAEATSNQKLLSILHQNTK
jgi:hypothetical protein